MPEKPSSLAPRLRVAIETHGCKLNQADSQVLASRFLQAGCRLVSADEEADVYVVNTCTVTHVADRKARHALRGARRRNPDALVVATGCYAQRAPASLQGLDGRALVVGNGDKGVLVRRVLEARGIPILEHDAYESPAYQCSGLRTRAMVKIQEGCDQVCAYCIVPKVRGRERSVPTETILAQLRERLAAGCREVVLTGTQLGSYGFDLPDASLERLVQRVLQGTSLERLRVSSLQPQEITDGLLALWEDPRLCPHFHLPLQSGSDAVLRRMRRRYTAADYICAVERVRQRLPHAAITADVIVGFPGETGQEFQETYRLCQRIAFAGMHLFPYSPRPGTTAAYMRPQVPSPVKRERMDQMLALAGRQRRAFHEGQLGSVRPVLWERRGDGPGFRWSGLTDTYVPVHTESPAPLANCITLALLEAVDGDHIRARLLP